MSRGPDHRRFNEPTCEVPAPTQASNRGFGERSVPRPPSDPARGSMVMNRIKVDEQEVDREATADDAAAFYFDDEQTIVTVEPGVDLLELFPGDDG